MVGTANPSPSDEPLLTKQILKGQDEVLVNPTFRVVEVSHQGYMARSCLKTESSLYLIIETETARGANRNIYYK